MLLDRLLRVEPKTAVEQELQALFELIDEDGSGSIDLVELQQTGKS
jgi:Ca2+-binding EF-hand superfamily protein